MNSPAEQFVQAANPHQWLLSADDLHLQAVSLYRRRGGGHMVHRAPGQQPQTWDDTNRATYLLCAFALENAIKAFLVYENPQWISDGRLSRELLSHRLVQLSVKSTQIPYRSRDEWVLRAFEEGNESWMRYPCGRTANDLQPQNTMHSKLWVGYLRVMDGYGRKLMRLLGKGWTGPNDWKATWEMSGEWLGVPRT